MISLAFGYFLFLKFPKWTISVGQNDSTEMLHTILETSETEYWEYLWLFKSLILKAQIKVFLVLSFHHPTSNCSFIEL